MKTYSQYTLCFILIVLLSIQMNIVAFANEATPLPDAKDSKSDISGSTNDPEILQEFMEQTAFMKTDPNYSNFLRNNAPLLYFSKFQEAMGGTEEEWNELSDYDKFCIVKLYLMPYGFAASGDYSRYFKDQNTFLSHMAVDSGLNVLSIKGVAGTEEVHEAIRAVWVYQYDHFMENGTMDNLFIKWYDRGDDSTLSQPNPPPTISISDYQGSTSELSMAENSSTSHRSGFVVILLVGIVLITTGYMLYQHQRKKRNKKPI